MQAILSSWFIQGMIKATSDMWHKGWDERNGGNISLRLLAEEVEPYRRDFYQQPRNVELTQPAPELANSWFLVTGSGKFFRNVELNPAENLVLLQVSNDGTAYHIHWGLTQGGLPTSELAAHFQSHIVKMQVSGGTNRVIMHCHATNLIALSYVQKLETPASRSCYGKAVRNVWWYFLMGLALCHGWCRAPMGSVHKRRSKCVNTAWCFGLSTVFLAADPHWMTPLA